MSSTWLICSPNCKPGVLVDCGATRTPSADATATIRTRPVRLARRSTGCASASPFADIAALYDRYKSDARRWNAGGVNFSAVCLCAYDGRLRSLARLQQNHSASRSTASPSRHELYGQFSLAHQPRYHLRNDGDRHGCRRRGLQLGLPLSTSHLADAAIPSRILR